MRECTWEVRRDVDIGNIFYLGDHAEVSGFAIQCEVKGVKPPSCSIWNWETCDSFADLINTTCVHFQPAISNGETFMGDGISRRDGWSLQTWLVFTRKGLHDRGNFTIYSHMEAE